MARKKTMVEVEPEVVEDAPVAVMPEPKSKPVVTVRAIYNDLHHPFQLRWLPLGVDVEVIRDNWIDSQIKAKLLTVIE